jgi:two-component sensor histidine kinase
VKNNLQVVSSLMNMQMRRIKHKPSREALQECQTRVQAIALIHEMLYRSKDYSRILFSEYARSLAANVFNAAGVAADAISMDLAIDDVLLGVDQAIPCGLILNELISNALKHAFPNGRRGVVRVELRSIKPGRLLLAVKDNGIGLPPDIDVKTSHSLGMHLVYSLAEQLGAEFEILRDQGTSLKLTFAADEVHDMRNAIAHGSSLEATG